MNVKMRPWKPLSAPLLTAISERITGEKKKQPSVISEIHAIRIFFASEMRNITKSRELSTFFSSTIEAYARLHHYARVHTKPEKVYF